MAFNIKEFKSNISAFGYLKPHNYEVAVSVPPFMQGSSLISSDGTERPIRQVTDKMLVYRIDQVSIPGVSLYSVDVQRYGIGPTQKMPFNAFFHDITFTVLLDKKADLYHFWYDWVRSIFEFNGKETPNEIVPSYETRYKSDFSSVMQIIFYDNEKNVVKRINLYDAFPSSVREIPLAWNDQGDLIRLSISITYSQFTVDSGGIKLK